MLQAYSELNSKSVERILAQEFLTELMQDGVFHADLHAGNVLIDLPNKSINFVDCGSTGQTDHSRNIKDLIVNLYTGDYRSVASLINENFLAVQMPDTSELVLSVQRGVSSGKSMSETFKNVLWELLDKEIAIKPEFEYILKSLAVVYPILEDIGNETFIKAAGLSTLDLLKIGLKRRMNRSLRRI